MRNFLINRTFNAVLGIFVLMGLFVNVGHANSDGAKPAVTYRLLLKAPPVFYAHQCELQVYDISSGGNKRLGVLKGINDVLKVQRYNMDGIMIIKIAPGECVGKNISGGTMDDQMFLHCKYSERVTSSAPEGAISFDSISKKWALGGALANEGACRRYNQ
jgi:hypothetical protein